MKETKKIKDIWKKMIYFRDIEIKSKNIQKIKEQNFNDEAFLLCLIYLDQISSVYYKKKKNSNSFCNLLIHKSENVLFKKIHIPTLIVRLEEEYNRLKVKKPEIIFHELEKCKKLKIIYDKNELFESLNINVLQPEETNVLNYLLEVGAGTIADYCYKTIRNPSIHETIPYDENIITYYPEIYSAMETIINKMINDVANELGHAIGNTI